MARRRGHNEGSIYQRQDGRWVASVILPNGKRKSSTPRPAKRLPTSLKARKWIDSGVDLSADRVTVAAISSTEWLSASVKPSVKIKTYISATNPCAGSAIVPRIGTGSWRKLTALDLQALYTDLAEAGLSPRSVHHVHRVLHRAFVQAVRWKLIRAESVRRGHSA